MIRLSSQARARDAPGGEARVCDACGVCARYVACGVERAARVVGCLRRACGVRRARARARQCVARVVCGAMRGVLRCVFGALLLAVPLIAGVVSRCNCGCC